MADLRSFGCRSPSAPIRQMLGRSTGPPGLNAPRRYRPEGAFAENALAMQAWTCALTQATKTPAAEPPGSA